MNPLTLLIDAMCGKDDKCFHWWKGRFVNRNRGPKLPKVMRPWQMRQWLGLDDKGRPQLGQDGKEWIPPASANTRQRQRQAFRALSMKEITEKYGGEPRASRRRIALKLARSAHREHMSAA